jgi:hypothetical protein
VSDFTQYEALRDKGYDSRGAGVELQLTIRRQIALERQYAAKHKRPVYSTPQPPAALHAADDDFAKVRLDKLHVAKALALGGFPITTLNERGETVWKWPR